MEDLEGFDRDPFVTIKVINDYFNIITDGPSFGLIDPNQLAYQRGLDCHPTL